MLKLTEVRKAQGLSMSALARKAELHVSTVSLIENGRLKPYPGQREKLAKALGMEDREDELFEEV